MFIDVTRSVSVDGVLYQTRRFVHRDFYRVGWVIRFVGMEIFFSDADYDGPRETLAAAISSRDTLLSKKRTEEYIQYMPISITYKDGKVGALFYFRTLKPSCIEVDRLGLIPFKAGKEYNPAYTFSNMPEEFKNVISAHKLASIWLEKAMEFLVNDKDALFPTQAPVPKPISKEKSSKPKESPKQCPLI